jgi:hypothetical protein
VDLAGQTFSLSRTVALKFLPDRLTSSPDDLPRFTQEAEAADDRDRFTAEARAGWLFLIKIAPNGDAFRNDPHFDEIVRRLN